MFEWDDAFLVGIDEIDTQHKKFFKLGKQIYDSLSDYAGQDAFDEIMTLLSELKDYTVYHFSTEESLFKKYGYPDTENHIKEHKAFIDRLENLDSIYIDNHQKEALNELLTFAAAWIFKHISNQDLKYSSFLINAMKNDQ